MFKPYKIHDKKERIEVDHQLYLQSPELRLFLFRKLFSFNEKIHVKKTI